MKLRPFDLVRLYSVRSLLLGTLCVASVLSATGCSIGPDYVRPTVTVPAAYKENGTGSGVLSTAGGEASGASLQADSGWIAAAPADTEPRGAWWTHFNDPQLTALEARVNVSNQTIQKAVAQLQEARAMVQAAHAAYLPTVGATANASRLHDSANVIGHQQTAGRTFGDYGGALDASWEPDLWGRIAHENDAARAGAEASAADLESVRLGVHAELAVDYFNLRGLDASKQLFDERIADYRQTLDLTKSRFTVGVSSQADVSEAETQLQVTEAQDIDLGVARAQYEHAIATLTGVPASTFTLAPATADFAPPAIPVGLPSELLQRRPDIAAAERRVAAANDQIGIAQSAFFPDLVLSATGGIESSTLTNWLTAPSQMWAIGPALVGTLFDGGRRHAMTEKARAQYDASVADYRQTVLTAFQQVEDNLASLRILHQEASKQNEAVASAQKTLQLALDQYRIGTMGYLEVVTAQSTALTNERTAVDLERRQMDASVLLVKALGGIW
ncbi:MULTISPECIES: efflux transporter outer membrane subunit [Paraburkholderia]|uniref:efflux transporter outer membrane subunit n=1 Tax=Paraburkholderia TaxID=1822464 RepID=UPI0022510ADC|nr:MULTISPECIES: efflux transporter outer membrane subunit [Paraburkholderia]MCX4164224.1 efflux transporter outer membrane subunit [Paraburkholderia megapolitana]MDN7159718.1 efflux transporter outer membrane subunit [Paraburkholderia sp. CHISQ3]MDQ6496765.1 efflux transporter outer membrane subunit [Paraburkholderia megapolitana]